MFYNKQEPFQQCPSKGNTIPKFDIFIEGQMIAPPGICFHPALYGLETIYKYYPQGTILAMVRDPAKWYQAIEVNGITNQLIQCNELYLDQTTRIGDRSLTMDDVKAFYNYHNDHVRKFVADHPTLNYIEINIDLPNAGKILEEKIGISADCWKYVPE